MKQRACHWLTIAALGVALTGGWALAGSGGDTEDVVYMIDGREFHGEILSETETAIVFQWIDRKLGVKTRITLERDDIAQIEQDVALAGDVAPAAAAGEAASPGAAAAGECNDPLLPRFYVVPMKGQMGTDIHRDLYEEVVADIKKQNPDVVVFELDSKDFPDLMIPEVEDPRESRGFLMVEEFRDLVNMFKDELPSVRAVMWVKDSVGFSSLLALAFSELYMSPDARLAGLARVIDQTGADRWSDPDVRAKMSAAWSAYVKSFLEYGGYGVELADAMMWPERTLSASFKGREVIWSPNELGEFVVDDNTEKTVGFRAKIAEDLLISDGTVENLDDLAFLMGYREYCDVGANGQQMVEGYVEKWRKIWDQTQVWYQDYFQHQGWAGGDETLKWLGRAKRDLEQIITAMNRYKAVEVRWQYDMGITKLSLEIEVEKMKEQIRALKSGRGASGGGGGGGGMGRR